MPADVVRFGDGLELDRGAYELRRSGRALKLERIPMEILLLLVERPGQLLSREDIIARVWGQDVFLDTDNSINAAVRKIRQILKDDPEKPAFVQTVTGKGYRFIAAVTEVTVPARQGSVGSPETKAQAIEPDLVISHHIEEKPAANGMRKRWKLIVAAALLAALALSVVNYLYFHRTSNLTNKDTIVLADFTNTTGDPVFDGTLRQGMAVQLEQSPFLSLISEERIQQTLRLMGQPADSRLTPDIAREICERTDSAAVLDGSIVSLGSQYVLGLRAKNCRTGEVLDEEQLQAARKEDVLNVLGEIASKFRTRVGESLSTVKEHNTSLAEATTPSLEALKAYSAGWKVLSFAGSAAAVPFFKRAIEIDPKFAMAYASLGRMYGDMGEYVLSAESTSRAYELRDHASDNEKFFISASYDMQVIGNVDKAQQTCELWVQAYPRTMSPHAFLSGIIYPVSGKYEKAVEESMKAIDLDPDFAIGYNNLALSYAYLGRLGEAGNALQRASERKLEIPDFLVERYDLAFLSGDKPGMEREATLGQRTSGAEDWISDHEAFVLAYSGHLQQARAMSRRAADLAQQSTRQETAALYETGAGLREALFGNASAARRGAMAALDLSKGREVEYGVAFALAISGESFQSQTLANDLERRFPEDTSVRFSYMPALRGLLALNHGEPAKAIELLQAAVPYELGAPRSSFFGFFGALYPIYVRGEAYLAAHQGTEAVAEFQKIIDHRGIVVSDPIGALTLLQQARALALSGENGRAKAAYQNFLALWKDADPDLLILKQAKAEYAKLKSAKEARALTGVQILAGDENPREVSLITTAAADRLHGRN